MFTVNGLENVSAFFRLSGIYWNCYLFYLLNMFTMYQSSSATVQACKHFQLCIFAEESIRFGQCFGF